MSRGHVAGTLQTGVQPLQAFPTGQSLNGYAEHVYEQPEGEPPVETNSIRAWRDWPGLRNGQTELRLNNQRAPRVHGLGWGFDADANVWRPTAVDGSGRGISSAYSYGYDPTTGTWIPVLVDPTGRVEANSHGYGFEPDAGVWRPIRVDSTGAVVTSGTGPTPPELEPPTGQLSAWYRASDINQAIPSPIYTWTDRSGNGADLVAQLPPYGVPTLWGNLPDFNGQNAASFNGSVHLRRVSPPGYVGGDSAFSLYLVLKPDFIGSATVAFCWGPDGFLGRRVAYVLEPSGGDYAVRADFGGGWASNRYKSTASAQIFSAFLAHAQDCKDAEILINGAVPSTLIAPGVGGPLNVPQPVNEVMCGGLVDSPGFKFVGQIAEVLVYHKHHNAGERAQTLAYLSQRYAIPV